MITAKQRIRIARDLLCEAFRTGELDDFAEGCVRAAVSSCDGALDEAHPPLGTEPVSETTSALLADYLKKRFPHL